MKNSLFMMLVLLLAVQYSSFAQENEEEEKAWDIGGAFGLDFSQMFFLNPKVGAGEDRLALAGNISFYAKYKKGRFSWDNIAGLTFGVQRLGSFRQEKPFQKSVDELRFSSNAAYGITEDSPFGYSLDMLLVTQLTPTYDGNLLSPPVVNPLPVAQFFAPATLTISPGIAYKKETEFGKFSLLLSPASLKMILVGNDDIAQTGLHGNPFLNDSLATEEDFFNDWRVNPDGQLAGGGFYANNYIQFGAAFRGTYSNKFFKYKEGDKEKHRLLISTNLNLYTNYLRLPQHIDVEWITNVDVFLFKGLSIGLLTNLSWDYDIMVQVDTNGNPADGFEGRDRAVSFFQTLLIKYSVLF